MQDISTVPWMEILALMLDNYMYIMGSALLLLLVRWNYSVLIVGGGWQGAGRPPPKKRMSKDMLPPYPNGWYKVLEQKMLPKGKVVSVKLCGKKMVAFRAENGKVGILDAYCPHLGADLGVHGYVEGGCVVCPFHAWKFNPDGVCESIEYSDCIPKDSSIQSYEVLERNNVIYVWYDAELRDPSWTPPLYSQVEDKSWYLGTWSGHEVLTHIAEIPENGPDAAHLNVLHKENIFQPDLHPEKTKPGQDPMVRHIWSATWDVDKEQPHRSKMTVVMDIGLGPFIPSFMHVPVEAWQVGPGLVFLELQTIFGKILMSQNVTPVEQLRLRVEHYYYAEWTVPRIVTKVIGWAATRQFERDVDIWEAKTFLPKPKLTKGDGPISRYRSWFKSFYSENSVPFGAEDDTTRW
eukprot:TRINITY_DN7294_c0_g1_i1.p1 TRINITY_DN7294_c0_g1~~TRINITY_DN7294_c0_g1_i1.p1  ORF type:complete len:406 (+),score=179.11 TRINITY_DN7294_c0_g1_i1:57-1274(+)